ncbi:class I SAM-dependent methyltransferase [Candidatus Hodarchaeum mangrovi]
MSNEDNRISWDKLSDYYQAQTIISLEDVHYGPYAPSEKHLKLLDDVKGKDCLELGCGGGQISIVLAKWGAKSVTGLDISEKQLLYAQGLASRENVNIKFIRQDMENLSTTFLDESFDLIISVHAISYVEDIQKVFNESFRILRNNGQFLICILHPIQFVLWEALEEYNFEKIYSYFNESRDIWNWEDENQQKIASFGQRYRRFEELINSLIYSGFLIERIVEPKGFNREQLRQSNFKELAYYDRKINEKFIRVNQIIPFSLIISCRKKKVF